ncbi:MAG TPA: hypothetical protein DHN33_02495 [Eubacteriaceae bacterium]|nr:hypothetical protein [Eubacteriaceae bacterium]
MVELLSSVVSAQEYANVTLGETVVIIGAGPIGCLHAEIAKVRGAKEIIIVDINEKRLEMAKQFSVSKTILSSEINPVEQVLQWTEGFGADVVICATPVASTQSQGIDMLRKRGRLVIFGGVSAENPFTTLDSNKIHYNELAVMGAFAYGPVNFQKAFDLVAGKSIHTDGFITNIIPLQDVEKGIKAIRAGDALKVVMKPGQTS